LLSIENLSLKEKKINELLSIIDLKDTERQETYIIIKNNEKTLNNNNNIIYEKTQLINLLELKLKETNQQYEDAYNKIATKNIEIEKLINEIKNF